MRDMAILVFALCSGRDLSAQVDAEAESDECLCRIPEAGRRRSIKFVCEVQSVWLQSLATV